MAAWPRRTTTRTSKQVGLVEGFRSGLEDKNAEVLKANGIPVKYEEYYLTYNKPARLSKYTPDFPLPNGIIVETKGRFVTADRQKHLLIKEQHPDLDIRFVFSNSNSRISKQSKTTYAMWCNKHGFQFADKVIPASWIKEPAYPRRYYAAKQSLIKKGDEWKITRAYCS